MNILNALGFTFDSILRHQIMPAHCALFQERFQAPGVALSYPCFCFDLDRKPVAHDEVHFMAVSRPPK